MSELLKLAERCEQATAEQQRELLAEAWTLTHGKPPRANRGGDNPENKFVALLNAEGFESAAMMLVPEGWGKMVGDYWVDFEKKPPFVAECYDLSRVAQDDFADGELIQTWAHTPALALCAAALRAIHSTSTPGTRLPLTTAPGQIDEA